MRCALRNLHFALPLLLGLACSEPTQAPTADAGVSSVPDAGPTGPSYREYCEATRRHALSSSLECLGVPPEALARMLSWDINECPSAPPPNSTYDPVAAAECLEKLETGSCYTARCSGVVRGASAVGGECLDQSECAEGYCTANIAPYPCPGRCEALKAAGEACVSFTTADLTYRDNCEGYCDNGICKEAGPAPTVHHGPGEGEACAQDVYCDPGLICSRSELICIPKQEGNPCDVQQDCYGLHEQPDDVSWPQGYVLDCDAATHKCFRVYLKQLGEPCSAGECQPYLYCSEQGVCTVWPVIGEPCDDYFPNAAGCLRGVCEQASVETMGVCVPAARPGEHCNYDGECDSRWCDSDTKTCIAQCMTW